MVQCVDLIVKNSAMNLGKFVTHYINISCFIGNLLVLLILQGCITACHLLWRIEFDFLANHNFDISCSCICDIIGTLDEMKIFPT
jgi:hypothetical protein